MICFHILTPPDRDFKRLRRSWTTMSCLTDIHNGVGGCANRLTPVAPDHWGERRSYRAAALHLKLRPPHGDATLALGLLLIFVQGRGNLRCHRMRQLDES